MRPPQTRQNSNSPILPLHHDPSSNGLPVSPLQSSPPLHHTWNRLRNWLSSEYTELGDTLNYGIDPAVITAVQMELGLPLPSAVRDSYLMCDGQEVESSAGCPDGLFFGLTLLPLEDVLEEWRFWREVDEDPATGANTRLRSVMKSIPDGYVRKEYSCRGWLPLVTDRAGNYLGVDLHPGEQGTYGQVIVFGRDFDTKVVMWRGEGEGGWGRWLASFVDDLENSEGYELGATNDASSDSEDDVGYEGYFYSNGVGRDGGEGNTGGLRLTGEYKGWNVLEAWADRSVKRWMQAGVYKGDLDPAPRPDTEVSDVAAVTNSGPATEVAIPALQTGGLASGKSDPSPATADITDPNNGETPATPRKVAHKKSARSISQLFERKEKESGASSVKEDDEKEKDRSSKRGSMFGTPFKSLVSTKTKDKEKKTGGSDAMV
ncbi:Cell wall assembly regulator [Tulasnella sp. 403]|nr:Cell wall assembly regulator [Tulasnella sp. 403]